jgi:hypothetical protein
MNQSALKNYAPQARLDFIQAVKDRAAFFGLTPESKVQIQETGDVVIIGGQAFPKVVAQQRKALLQRIAAEGFEAVMEAMAYTWFNRFVALRFMEVHGYLDHGYRVLSHPAGKPNPEILDHAERVTLPGLDPQQVIQLKLDGNRDAELYRLLLVAQCNALHQAIPFVFGKIADETELLLPDNLLHSDSVIRRLVSSIEETDWQEVEILGWLYQFYISDKKDAVMARKSAVPTEDIPAVTQLFTPHWIVRYLVENSLGRLWLLNRPGSRLREHMPYYIEGEPETDFLKLTKPEEIRLCDPAVGSGHMLTYAFDLLTLIYEEEGYAPTEIPALILRHNLHGLEICARAAQLAELALVFKAREKSRRFFQPEHLVRPHIIELRDVRFAENELRDYIHALGLGDLFNQPVLRLLHQFEEAKNFGSLIQPCLDERAIADVRRAIEAKDLGGQLFLRETHLKVLRVLEQAEALTQRYHVVVANPPYMGNGAMNAELRAFLLANMKAGKADLYGAFILRNLALTVSGGSVGMITIPNWLFLQSFEEIRERLLETSHLSSLIHNGRGIWGGDFGSCAFTIVRSHQPEAQGVFRRLFKKAGEIQSNDEIEANFRNKDEFPPYLACSTDFAKMPGKLFAFWLTPRVKKLLAGPYVSELGETKRGLQPGDVPKFVRGWWEIASGDMEVDSRSRSEAIASKKRWFKFDSGGPFRKWFGNNLSVIDWESNGERIKNGNNPIVPSEHLYFRPGFVWSKVTIAAPSFRLHDGGVINGDASPCFFPTELNTALLGLFNSICGKHFVSALSPTLNFQVSDILKIPSCPLDDKMTQAANGAIAVSRADWDNFETSWDFRDQPLLRPGLKGATLEASWRNWEAQSTAAIRRMQELETENNRLFIAAYGLDGELQPEVPEEQITLFCNPASRYKRKSKKKKTAEDESADDTDGETEAVTAYTPEERSSLFKADTMREFLSYAVGCMMGRYSLDKSGLVYANSGSTGFDSNQYRTFAADADGIVPVTELAWFSDDATERFIEFLTKTFAPNTLEANLKFIAEALVPTKDETPRDTVRRYLSAGFYKDHLQTYKRRPIYWLFSSGKQRAFQCLVYLHRYNEGTLARMRTEYVIPLQGKIRHRIDQLAGDITAATSTSHRKKLEKERESLVKQATELAAFDEKLRHCADQRIALDLDDGVKVNYAKFGDLLAEVKAVTGGSEE